MSLDPIALSVLASGLAGIAEEMGAMLIRAAYSSNIKERRDCSTALFDAAGRMVAQAEHIPVHLGAMPEAVAAVMRKDPDPGDVFAINDPYSGGTHLPDITLISAIAADEEVVGYAVSRAHHSDVGGMRPGSMPADSRDIYQEGLIVPPVRVVASGRVLGDIVEMIVANSRTPNARRGDLRAQLAANALGRSRLLELLETRGRSTVLDGLQEVISYTERRTRQALSALPDGVYEARSWMEGDGVSDRDIEIAVAVSIEGDHIIFDFTGTSDSVPGNVNCPLAVTRSACLFALRTLLPEDVPQNAGTFAPMEILAPAGSLVNASPPAAVVAGNVETSQQVADVVTHALAGGIDVPAQGQGTMNNLVIGGRGWTYYETIGGGQGAGAQNPGASGVHVGMSNTLNTPIEALEMEFPLRVERYEIRRGSGGHGRHDGGDGVARELSVLEAATASLLSDHRRHAPRGRAGGHDGAVGRNLVNGNEMPAKVSLQLKPGDVVTIETPGGGGWGKPRGDRDASG